MKLESKFVVVSVADLLHHLASDRYMGKHEAEAYTGLSAKTLMTAPDLRKYQPNGKILFRRSEIDRWMERHAKDESIDFDSRMTELQSEFKKSKVSS